MKLTVVGAGPVCPNPGGASSGYLLESGLTRILIDCGPGVISRLQRYLAYDDLTAIVISHMHPDHMLDLVPLRYGLQYAPGPRPSSRPRLYLPPEGLEMLDALARALGRTDSMDLWRAVLEVSEFKPEVSLDVQEFRFWFVPVLHYVPAWGIRIFCAGRTVSYSSDSGPTDNLVELARGADLFLCEATLHERGDSGEWGHMTPEEAGVVARRAGAKRLVLTHMWEKNDPVAMRRQAERSFGGPVDVALEDMSYAL